MQTMIRAMRGWVTQFSSHEERFTPELVYAGKDVVEAWAPLFPREETWVQREHGVPSLIVRLDCTVCDGQLQVYEVEERPAGIGFSIIMNDDFVHRFRDVQRTWPLFDVICSPKRKGGDDHVWACVNVRRAPGGLVFVRAEPDEHEYHHFEPFSVSSLKREGDKGYGLFLGLWSLVHTNDALPWERGFVLKPMRGSKSRGVEIWDPKKGEGTSTRTRVLRQLETQGVMCCQLLHYPIATAFPDHAWMIYRVFYAFDIETRAWVCLGGAWNARSNLKIHGASDTLFGPLVVGA